jgi:hypothetical protein
MFKLYQWLFLIKTDTTAVILFNPLSFLLSHKFKTKARVPVCDPVNDSQQEKSKKNRAHAVLAEHEEQLQRVLVLVWGITAFDFF